MFFGCPSELKRYWERLHLSFIFGIISPIRLCTYVIFAGSANVGNSSFYIHFRYDEFRFFKIESIKITATFYPYNSVQHICRWRWSILIDYKLKRCSEENYIWTFVSRIKENYHRQQYTFLRETHWGLQPKKNLKIVFILELKVSWEFLHFLRLLLKELSTQNILLKNICRDRPKFSHPIF